MSHKKHVEFVTFPLGADEYLWFSEPHVKFMRANKSAIVTVDNALRKQQGSSFVENINHDPKKPIRLTISSDSAKVTEAAAKHCRRMIEEVYSNCTVDTFTLPPLADARDFCNNVNDIKDIFEKEHNCKVICTLSKGAWEIRIASKSPVLLQKAKVAFCSLPLLKGLRYSATWEVTHIENCSALDKVQEVVDKFNSICAGQHVIKCKVEEFPNSACCSVTLTTDSQPLFSLLCFHLDNMEMCARDSYSDKTEHWSSGVPVPPAHIPKIKTIVRQPLPGTNIALDYQSASTTV